MLNEFGQIVKCKKIFFKEKSPDVQLSVEGKFLSREKFYALSSVGSSSKR
ncbi:MAG: hypothetical protein IJG80_08105 [Selenomonadaceae bacterium]|nr:hypothetical protein [Selenomonadaceae bacterium]